MCDSNFTRPTQLCAATLLTSFFAIALTVLLSTVAKRKIQLQETLCAAR